MRKPDWIQHYGIIGIPMVDTRGRFHAPSSFGDEVVIESRIEKAGRSSFEVYHRLMRGEVLGAEGWEKRVWAGRHPNDPARLKAVPIPPEVRNRLGLAAA
jgi:4-hydroxybenzoyl-CoA thioesterase